MNEIKKIAVITIYFFVLFTCKVIAQDTTNTIGQVSIASPTAASLGKYGDIPVSYHTGIPQISVPVYTVESGSLKLPITLSYHASGIKVQEPAGWVGTGWSLNAGGMISRTVVGAPDDKGTAVNNVTNGYYTDYGYNSYLNGSGSSVPDDAAFSRGSKDGEPDLYFFNFGNYTGKFYFNDDRTPIIVPEQDFKIQPFLQAGQGFIGFIVTTPDGTRYFFGQTGNDGTVSPVESTTASTIQNGYSNANAAAASWFLNKVMSADGTDSINLSYKSENYSYYTISMFPVLSSNYNPSSGTNTKAGFNMVKNFVTGVRLSQINFPNGQVNFTPSATARTDLTAGNNTSTTFNDITNTNSYSLGSISISNNLGFCKKDSMYYGYFFDGSALNSNLSFYNSYSIHSDEYRLRLDSVLETSCDGSIKVPPYKFNYFTEQMPRRLSFGLDHWGYPNGVTTNSTLVPTYTVSTSGQTPVVYQGDNRDASWPAMRGGTLQQITYPTGGYTSLVFEPKAIYTYTGDTLEDVPLISLVDNMFGQSQLTATGSFTVQGNGNNTGLSIDYTANYSGTFNIVNSSNTNVYSNNNVYSSYQTSVSLPAGTYNATLTVPSTQGITGGAEVTIDQYQNVPVQLTQTVGGLRIKTIISNDGLTPNNVLTSYNYLDNSSQGNDVLYSIPTYIQTIRNNLLAIVWPSCSPNGCSSCDGFGGHTYYISPASIRPMSSAQGENMGYNEVDVSQTGNGHSVYKYYSSNIWRNIPTDVCVRSLSQSSVCDPNIPNFPAAPLPFDYMRDELSYEGHFNQAGQALKETYYYPFYAPDSLVTPGHITVNVPGMSSYTEYNLQSVKKIQNQIVQTVYDPVNANPLTTTNTVYYGSLFHNQPTRKVSGTSTGDSLAVNMRYALDFRISSCDAIPDSLPYYMNTIHRDTLWMDSAVVNCSPQTNMSNNCRWANFIQFREMLMQARQQFITYRRRSFAPDTSNIISRCYATAFTSADTLLKPILRLQNEYYNATIESSEWKDLNLLHASYTRFDTSANPVGFVYPSRTKLINLQATSLSFTNATVSGSTISKDSRYADESFYTFNNGNPVQVLPRDGIANSYIWDYLNTEPVAKASNAPLTQIAYTSFEADGKGNWTFAGAPISDPTSPTGAKCYQLSNGNITKTGLPNSSYVVSYWSKSGASVTIAGGGTSGKQGKIINGWTYNEFTVTGATSITVSGSGYIDELRLYPTNAQMTTYTYIPLLGMTSACDADNKITYYFYDGLGRLKWIKDQDLNIIKTLQYHYSNITGIQY